MNHALLISNVDCALEKEINDAWYNITPCWPLKSIIAVNPLNGLLHLSFDDAVNTGDRLFKLTTPSDQLHKVNRETIKWCQAYFDEGQSTIQMPLKELGLYQSVKKLLLYDKNISKKNKALLRQIDNNSIKAIKQCVNTLKENLQTTETFIKIALTTLPGWAGYIKYKAQHHFLDKRDRNVAHDYLAIRLIFFLLFFEKNDITLKSNDIKKIDINMIHKKETAYQNSLLKKLTIGFKKNDLTKKYARAEAQFIFCIDVRSEPFRRAIESEGNYETYGFAGFFGLPICVESFESEKHPACPALLQPIHTVKEKINYNNYSDFKKSLFRYRMLQLLKNIYQQLKYNFSTPFLLAEVLGPYCGIGIIVKTFFPNLAYQFKRKISPAIKTSPTINEIGILEGIPFSKQVDYAENMLRMINLTKHFSKIIVLCGHGSSTNNNTYATSLDCGACGGHDGASNARIMAEILNTEAVRDSLKKRKIIIPSDSQFIAALHNTTTDQVTLFSSQRYTSLEHDLDKARLKNINFRSNRLTGSKNVCARSIDWAQTRPEWGLANNAAFIVGMRENTKEINLEGRCFLHCYNWQTDDNLKNLTAILTAPMIVAQWINCQYFFSTLDPITYGSGSKITHNVTGKFAVMQGNASDIQCGLPLQSTHQSDVDQYHEPIRLNTIIYAPRDFISSVIKENDLLKQLAKNAWVFFFCIDPNDRKTYFLQSNLQWQDYENNPTAIR